MAKIVLQLSVSMAFILSCCVMAKPVNLVKENADMFDKEGLEDLLVFCSMREEICSDSGLLDQVAMNQLLDYGVQKVKAARIMAILKRCLKNSLRCDVESTITGIKQIQRERNYNAKESSVEDLQTYDFIYSSAEGNNELHESDKPALMYSRQGRNFWVPRRERLSKFPIRFQRSAGDYHLPARTRRYISFFNQLTRKVCTVANGCDITNTPRNPVVSDI